MADPPRDTSALLKCRPSAQLRERPRFDLSMVSGERLLDPAALSWRGVAQRADVPPWPGTIRSPGICGHLTGGSPRATRGARERLATARLPELARGRRPLANPGSLPRHG